MNVEELKKAFGVRTDEELGARLGRKGGVVSVWRKSGIPASVEKKARELLGVELDLDEKNLEDSRT